MEQMGRKPSALDRKSEVPVKSLHHTTTLIKYRVVQNKLDYSTFSQSLRKFA